MREPPGILPVPVQHVEVNQVCHEQTRFHTASNLDNLVNSFGIRLRVYFFPESPSRKQIVDFSDGNRIDTVLHENIEQGLAWRLQRKVLSVWGPCIAAALSYKRPCNHTPRGV